MFLQRRYSSSGDSHHEDCESPRWRGVPFWTTLLRFNTTEAMRVGSVSRHMRWPGTGLSLLPALRLGGGSDRNRRSGPDALRRHESGDSTRWLRRVCSMQLSAFGRRHLSGISGLAATDQAACCQSPVRRIFQRQYPSGEIPVHKEAFRFAMAEPLIRDVSGTSRRIAHQAEGLEDPVQDRGTE